MNSGCIYAPLLCMVELLYFNMVGANEATDLCTGANYDFSPSIQGDKALRQEPEGA